MVPPFVKKYDFRGIYNQDIKDEDAFYLGRALYNVLPLKKILVGWDTRPSSKQLALHFLTALSAYDVQLFYIDTCPIDYITAAANAGDFELSVMFTGSHNPYNWTGLLIHTAGGDSLTGDNVTKVVEEYYEQKKKPAASVLVHLENLHNYEHELELAYKDKISSLIKLHEIKPLKVLVDIGDGSGYKGIDILEKLLPQVTFERMHNRKIYDAESSHIADPSEEKNVKDLMDAMTQGGYDAGFAFDSDADRVLAVDENGSYLNGSLLGSTILGIQAYAEMTLEKVGYAVDCGPSLPNTLLTMDQAPIPVPVGRSILRGKLRTGELDLGVENVGHFYSADFFKTDSGAFMIAIILLWMSHNGPLSNVLKKYPDGQRGQVFIPVTQDGGGNLDILLREINNRYQSHQIRAISVDGTRYEFVDNEKILSWYAVRKSGYEPIEKYYFGALDETEFNSMRTIIEKLIPKGK